jgi:hypothetical protein
VSVLHSFFLAMVLYPEVQRKAQEEIDSVVGKDRLPDFGDQPLLPYVNAILEEALCWHPVVPLGTPQFQFVTPQRLLTILSIFTCAQLFLTDSLKMTCMRAGSSPRGLSS